MFYNSIYRFRNENPLPTDKFHKLGESLDKLISFDVNGRGIILPLYTGTRMIYNNPLTSTAALALNGVIQRGSPILMITGFPSLSWLLEDAAGADGPVGTAVLARVLEEVYGAIPVIVTSRNLVRYVNAALTSAGLIPADITTALASKPQGNSAPVAGVLSFTTDASEGPKEANLLLTKINPAAVIAIEMPGPGQDGKCRTYKGRIIPDKLFARGDAIFAAAQSKGILTVGFGDGGNELGMGRLAKITSQLITNGELISCVIPADITVASSISNWGAYGVAAASAALVSKTEVLKEIDIEKIIRNCSNAGVLDGFSDRVEDKEDKVPSYLSKNVISLMHFTVQQDLNIDKNI